MAYMIHRDPGHAWLAVPKKDCVSLLIMHKISQHSYVSRSGKMIYLEEDCDAGLFIEAYRNKYGKEPQFKSSKNKKTYYFHSHIRSLPRFPSEYWRSITALAAKEVRQEFSNVVSIKEYLCS